MTLWATCWLIWMWGGWDGRSEHDISAERTWTACTRHDGLVTPGTLYIRMQAVVCYIYCNQLFRKSRI